MHHTLVAVFDDFGEAQRARSDLVSSGFQEQEIHLDTTQGGTAPPRASSEESSIGHFFRSLIGKDENANEAEEYERAMQLGKTVLSLDADEAQDERAIEILKRHHPIELQGDDDATLRAGEGQDIGPGQTEAIPVVEEELKVGKREVQRGGVRIYKKVTERPVEQEINLKEEKVTIERSRSIAPATRRPSARPPSRCARPPKNRWWKRPRGRSKKCASPKRPGCGRRKSETPCAAPRCRSTSSATTTASTGTRPSAPAVAPTRTSSPRTSTAT
jgi:hypothetical protein